MIMIMNNIVFMMMMMMTMNTIVVITSLTLVAHSVASTSLADSLVICRGMSMHFSTKLSTHLVMRMRREITMITLMMTMSTSMDCYLVMVTSLQVSSSSGTFLHSSLRGELENLEIIIFVIGVIMIIEMQSRSSSHLGVFVHWSISMYPHCSL